MDDVKGHGDMCMEIFGLLIILLFSITNVLLRVITSLTYN